MKRPSCLQKFVTGKPPWPRQGISFSGPSQLGQRFPTKEQRKVTTADSDGVSLDARMPENTPGHSFMDFHPLGITPGPRRPGHHNGPDQSHTWVGKSGCLQNGIFHRSGERSSEKKILPYLFTDIWNSLWKSRKHSLTS